MPNVSKIEVDEIGGATGTTLTLTTGHVITGSTGQFQISGGTAGQALTTDGTGNLTFVDMTSDPTMGGDLTGTASNAQIAANAVGTVEIATDAVTSNEIATDAVTSSEIATDAVGSSEIAAGAVGGTEIASTFDISSKTVTLPAASVTDHVIPFDDNTLKEEIALLGFRTAANGSLAKYNLVDQTIDAFEDASGIDASASTGEIRDATGKYYTSILYGSYSFSSNTSTGAGTWTCPTGVTSVEAVIVAGGGQGSCPYHGSGGGGGGIVYDTAYTVVPAVVYDFTVGAGGTGAASNGTAGNNGADSTWNDNAEGSGVKLTAKGGGGGGCEGVVGVAGGSGGGGSYNQTAGVSNQQSSGTPTGGTITSYGNDGAVGLNAGGGHPAGGGGGAAVEPADGTADGGAGQLFSNFTSYGESGYFGGGGGGAVYSSSTAPGNFDGVGGVGGGGDAVLNGSSGATGNAGTANTGGGGAGSERAGGSGTNNPGGAGGSGGIYLRYRTESVSATMSLVSNTTTAQAAPTKGDIVFTYTNGVGTTTIGGASPDVTAEYSADGGSTWTSMTLASEGSTGGHNIATAHDVTLTSTSGTAMRYRIKTLNQSASKETRIQAVSLGWS